LSEYVLKRHAELLSLTTSLTYCAGCVLQAAALALMLPNPIAVAARLSLMLRILGVIRLDESTVADTSIEDMNADVSANTILQDIANVTAANTYFVFLNILFSSVIYWPLLAFSILTDALKHTSLKNLIFRFASALLRGTH
jgi:hypothetical protein